MTQINVDLKRFKRAAIWNEFWFDRESEDQTDLIFKKEKDNLPKNHTVPEDLKTFLSAVTSEIQDPRNRITEKSNLPHDEQQALKELVKLQKEKHIVIKACDKGAGIIILDYSEYVKACYKHLTSSQSEGNPYYTQVDALEVERSKAQIESTLLEALKDNIISQDEFHAMNPKDKEPGRFYCNFKVHKKHEHGQTPPERPIISGSGSLTEGIGMYVNHHIKETGTKHPTYLQDTSDFLRIIEEINDGPKLPSNALIATLDVHTLFTNIAHEEGLACTKEQLDKRIDQKIPTDFLIKLMKLILYNNIFEFHESYWKQNIGAAMGSKPVPHYADIFMSQIDEKIEALAEEDKAAFLALLKRFLDDFFLLYFGSSRKLHELFEKINNMHPTIKFTMSHTTRDDEPLEDRCDCDAMTSIPFLDTSCSIIDGRIDTDLFKKETDRNQYLLPSSCHPSQTKKAIPFGLSMRIIRICRDPEKRDQRLQEMRKQLMDRGYPNLLLDSAIERARQIPRKVALKRVNRQKKTNGPIFAHTYDPRLPPMAQIQARHWRTMVHKNSYLAEVFTRPPLTAYRRQPNLRNYLIRAKLPKNERNKRVIKGMKKCGKGCPACPYIKEGKSVKINNKEWKINKPYDCNSFNVVYAVICKKEKCKKAYLGETKRMLKFRLADHCGYVRNQTLDQATGEHFSLPGHSLSDLSITVIEQSKRNNNLYRKEREEYHINRFNTFYKGLNKKKK